MNNTTSSQTPVSLSEGETVQHETTTISNDASDQTYTPGTFADDQLFSEINISGVKDLKALIERPVRLQAGTFSASDTTRLYSSDPFLALMNTWSTKLDRAQLVKADVEVILQVNAMRFQAGRYLLAFLSSFGHTTADANFTAYDKMHAATLMQLTQLPHVEIDIAYETQVSMVIPWDAVISAWPNQTTVTQPVGFGKLILFPYSALIPESTAATAGYTLYARFVNSIVAQPTLAQSGTEKEQKKAGIGPVTGFIDKVTKSTKVLSELPLVGPYLGQLSWASSLLGKATSVFGWSKPPVLSAPDLMQPRYQGLIEVSDGASTARPLGGFSTNSVQPFGQGATPDVDEMALSFISQKYAYWRTVNWTTAQTAGTAVYNMEARPTSWYTTFSLATYFPPVTFPLNFFAKWRGGLKIRLKLVKNEFYSGRLGVLFQPVEPGGSLATTTADLGLAYNRVIIDIRTSNTYEIHVPYTSVNAYLDAAEGFGSIVIFVVDPLVCPDNMAGTVPILIEVAGCEDFEYAEYSPQNVGPMVPYAAQSGNEVQVFKLGETGRPSLAPAKVAIGERFTSLRQLTKLYCFKGNFYTYDAAKTQYYNPFTVLFAGQPTSPATAYIYPELGFDTVNLIMACYGKHLGSMRVQAIPTQSSGQTTTMQYGLGRVSGTITQFTVSAFNWCRNMLHVPREDIDVIVPAFTKTAGRALPAMLSNANLGAPILPTGVGVTNNCLVTRVWSGGAPSSFCFYRQFSDDGTCTNFVSIPGISPTGY